MRGESSSITEDNIKQWFNENYETISKKEHAYLKESARIVALKQVMKYVDRQGGNWDRIRDAEVEVPSLLLPPSQNRPC